MSFGHSMWGVNFLVTERAQARIRDYEDRAFMDAVAGATISVPAPAATRGEVLIRRGARRLMRKRLESVKREPSTAEVWAD
jgi:hypothetical protein